jgi:hypothetical protein
MESEWEQQNLEQLRREIGERLKPVLGDLPQEEFDQLVERMARVQRKFERFRREDFFPESDDPGGARSSE